MQVSMSSTIMMIRLFSAREVMTLMNLNPMPVAVMQPTTMPAQAQQVDTMRALRAVDLMASRKRDGVKRVAAAHMPSSTMNSVVPKAAKFTERPDSRRTMRIAMGSR